MSLARESREQTDAWNQRLEVSMREQADQAESELKKTVEAQAQEVESVLQAELETELKRSELQHQDAIAATVDAFKAANLQLTLEREQMAERLHSDVAMVQAHILAQVSAEKMRHKVNRISASGMALVTQLQSSDGLKAQVTAVQQACGDDPVLTAAVATINGILKQRSVKSVQDAPSGVPSLFQLQKRFERVHQAIWRELSVPEGWHSRPEGQLVGTFLAAVRSPSQRGDSGNKNEDILANASTALRGGALRDAVLALEQLEGVGSQPVSDWLIDARHRLLADQAGSMVRARVSLLNRSVV